VRYVDVLKSYGEESVVVVRPSLIVKDDQAVPVIGKLPIVNRNLQERWHVQRIAQVKRDHRTGPNREVKTQLIRNIDRF